MRYAAPLALLCLFFASVSSAETWHPTDLERERALELMAEHHIVPYDRAVCDREVWWHLMRYINAGPPPAHINTCPKLDRHTVLVNPMLGEDARRTFRGEFAGVGLELDLSGDVVVVHDVMDGGPGEKGGIQTKDQLLSVTESDGSKTALMPENAVKTLIGKGEKGSVISVELLREGEQKTLSIIRDTITLPSVHFRVETLSFDGKELPRPVGVFVIDLFASNTADQFEEALVSFQSMHGADAPIVVDLWNNPGGIWDSAFEFLYLLNEEWDVPTISLHRQGRVTELSQRMPMPDCFKGSEPMIMVKGQGFCIPFRDPKTGYLKTPGRFQGLRMAVLISGHSASASEIVSAAIKESVRGRDRDRMPLIGEITFGKGVAQEDLVVVTTPDRSPPFLRVTSLEFRAAGNTKIHEVGVVPDYLITEPKDGGDVGKVLNPFDGADATRHMAAYEKAYELFFGSL